MRGEHLRWGGGGQWWGRGGVNCLSSEDVRAVGGGGGGGQLSELTKCETPRNVRRREMSD